MKAKLVSPESAPVKWEIELDEFPIVIGRSPDAGIRPTDTTIAAHHCEIDKVNGRLMVRDLGSQGGTFINGRQIDLAPLLPGDRLTVGGSSFLANYDLPPIVHRPRRRRQEPADLVTEPRDGPAAPVPDELTFFDLVSLLERQRELFREQNERQPWQEEALFPDPPHPEYVEHLIAEELRRVGAEPHFIYAFEKTGILVTEFNYDSISEQELDQWQAAIEEYEDRQGSAEDEAEYPLGVVTMYGPDGSFTTLVVASVMEDEDAQPVHRRWFGSTVKSDVKVKQEIADFFLEHDVHSVVLVRENIGCPHEEGLDYPVGEDCPFCPYWKGRQSGPA
jgi:hypothetical protein